MRVLYLATRICWPILSGGHLRDFHLARELAKHAELTYVGMDIAEDKARPENVWQERLDVMGDAEVVRVRRDSGYSLSKIARGLLGPTPLVVLNYTSATVMNELQRILERSSFDVIQIEGVFVSSYAARIRQLAPSALLNSDWHNIESEVLERYAENEPNFVKSMYARRTVALLQQQENKLLSECDTHTVCSERERQVLLGRKLNSRIEVIANGVDVDSFSSKDASPARRRDLLFVGSMDYHPNVEAAMFFAAAVWPSILARRPDLRFVIVGSKPAPAVLALRNQPGIVVTGTVDDVRPYYRDALAAVIPLRVGGGTRLKVLEAMAAGTPVISTTLGAEGLMVSDGSDIILADSPAQLIEASVTLDENSSRWQEIVINARKLVREQYDWSVIGSRLLRLYSERTINASV